MIWSNSQRLMMVNCSVTFWEQKLLMWNILENTKTRKLTPIGWMALWTHCCLQMPCWQQARVFKRLRVTFTKIRDEPHKAWVCLEGAKSGCKIVTSWCTCRAGTAEVCNHVIALIYKVNFTYKKVYISPARTSVPQGWNIGTKKDVQPDQIKNLVIRKDKKTQEESTRDHRTSLTQGNCGIDSWPIREFHPWSMALLKIFHQLVCFVL